MKKHIQQLQKISKKRTRRIIGLMSGTSLDGLDVACCAVSGQGMNTKVRLEYFATIDYAEDFKAEIRAIFAKQTIDFHQLIMLNVIIAEKHGDMILQCLHKWGLQKEAIDLIASHGQTVLHLPKILHKNPNLPNATLQIGDGDHLAARTGIITLSDFRQKHIAAGGEGAPLALFGDYLIFSKKGQNRVLLNIGGIANFTYLPASGAPDECLATDTGPGNTLLDACARKYFNVNFDRDSLLAEKGIVDDLLLARLKAEEYFGLPFPKTTGPELFNETWLEQILETLPKGHNNPYNIMATLSRFTAETIAEAVKRVLLEDSPEDSPPCPLKGESLAGRGNSELSSYAQNSPFRGLGGGHPITFYTSGGGAHNPLIVNYLKEIFPKNKFFKMQKLGIDGDAKEAVLFAVLANETVAGNTSTLKKLGTCPFVSMGKISFPLE